MVVYAFTRRVRLHAAVVDAHAHRGWRVGEATITPIHETDAGTVIQAGMAQCTPRRLRQVPWLRPHFADGSGRMLALVQSFVIRLGGATILVDTCVGNHKPRPGLPAWSRLATDFLQRLCVHGVEPAEVDLVICTHLHFDHVGWNTVPTAAGGWAPTFPRARYIVSEPEFSYWRALPARESADDLAGITDSVLPVHEAGLLDLVACDSELLPGLRLLRTAGHTPGHVSVLVQCGAARALISGDALHHPAQLANPRWGIFSDFDPERAHRTRLDLLGMCADTGTVLIGSHFAAPTAIRVKRAGAAFEALTDVPIA